MARLRLNSLAARLIAAAAVWTMLGLVLGGLVLSSAFRNAVEDNFDADLTADMDGLIAAANPDASGAMVLQDQFVNHQFDRVYSGLYYQIKPLNGGGSVISRSLYDHTLSPVQKEKQGNMMWGTAPGPEDQTLRVAWRKVVFPVAGGERDYMFYVAGDLAAVDAESAAFNGTLIWSFLLLGIGLVIAVFLQVRIGLKPLRQLRQSLARIRDGKAQELEGDFPAEIAPLAGELNSLIAHSAEIVGRARTHVSNLAHFLKTPLSVLASEADAAPPSELSAQVRRQVDVMRRQVDHYLTRARAAGSVNVLGNRTPVAPVLSDLARVLTRVHGQRDLDIAVECAPEISFRGERQDLEEMAGNLMDNACKWARHRVLVRVVGEGARLVLTVEDDGPGLSEEQRKLVGARGERLDESVPGSGLGLAIVRDISKLYGGFLELGPAGLGGLQTRLQLPALG